MMDLKIEEIMNEPFIKRADRIADFIKYSYDHTTKVILPEMQKLGLAWKHTHKVTSEWVTSPYFLHLYFYFWHESQRKEAIEANKILRRSTSA